MPEYENGQTNLLITEFDLKTTNGSTQMIKALIPFFSPREQHMLAMIVRIQELIMTVRYFEKLSYIQQQNNIKLSFNKDLFDQYNLELPTDWASLTTAIETFKENGIIPIACSLNNVPHYWIEFMMLYAAGEEEYTSIP